MRRVCFICLIYVLDEPITRWVHVMSLYSVIGRGHVDWDQYVSFS